MIRVLLSHWTVVTFSVVAYNEVANHVLQYCGTATSPVAFRSRASCHHYILLSPHSCFDISDTTAAPLLLSHFIV